jgi:hypothetical protein
MSCIRGILRSAIIVSSTLCALYNIVIMHILAGSFAGLYLDYRLGYCMVFVWEENKDHLPRQARDKQIEEKT